MNVITNAVASLLDRLISNIPQFYKIQIQDIWIKVILGKNEELRSAITKKSDHHHEAQVSHKDKH